MKQNLRTLGILTAVCLLFTGCGTAEESGAMRYTEAMDMGYMADMDMVMEAETMAAEAPAKMYSASTSAQTPGNTSAPVENDLANRKLIRNANVNVETKTYDDFTAALEQQMASHGAYVQNGETNGSAERGNRWASYTIRIPENRYTSFLSVVSEMGTVTYKSESVQDVTMEYTDVEARIRALEVEHDTLLSILEKCERLEDVITVQSRITEVQYQLDSYQSRLRRYDDLISYCTVYLSVNEVERVTVPPAELTLGERIREDLAENCAEIAEDAEDFAVWFVSSLPFFGIWIVVIGGVVLVALRLGKRSRRKLKERMAKRAETQKTAISSGDDHTDSI